VKALLLGVDEDPPPSDEFDTTRVTRTTLPDRVRHALEAGCTRFGIVGSDGDAALVAGQAHRLGARVEIAIDPNGDLSRVFGLGSDSATAHRLVHGTPYPVDLGIVEGGWGTTAFLNDVGFGVASARPGPLRWFLSRRSRVAVTGRRRVEHVRSSGVLITNGQFWHGLVVSPKASLGDSRFEYQVIAVPRRRSAAALSAMRLGLHDRSHGLQRGRGNVIEVEVPAGWRVAADRRDVGRGSATVRAIPGTVSLLI
jgi:diacylglycerol kinase family enzyme